MTLPAIETYSDDKLNDLLNACINEQERRANVARIPEQIAGLQALYVEGGGDNPSVLEIAITPTPDPDEA